MSVDRVVVAVVLGVAPGATPFWELAGRVATEVFPGG